MGTSWRQSKRSTRFSSHAMSPQLANFTSTVLFPTTREAVIPCLFIRLHSSKLATVETPHKIQTFHSTVCWCDLGRSEIKFCTWRACGICTIIKSAFTTFEFGIKSNSGRSVESTSTLIRSIVLTLVPARFGPGIYSYLKPSLADRWAVCSPPHRVMLACEVKLLPTQVKPSESSGILRSVSYYHVPSCPGLIRTLPTYSTKKDRWCMCQGLRRSHQSIS